MEGTPDVAYVTGDEALSIAVGGREGVRIARVELLVDGGRPTVLRECRSAPCPRSATVAVRPELRRAGAGAHRVTVRVHGTSDDQRGSRSIHVTVGRRLPPLREGEPAAVTAEPPRSGSADASVERAVRRIIAREQRSGVLRAVLRDGTPWLVEVGELRAGARRIGATVLLEMPAPVRGVRATVPGYVPAGLGYRPQRVRLEVRLLRDLLVDVDLRRRTVIGVEPGPASQTSTWAPERAAAPTGAEDED
ncbi:MAG: hypothetical protein HZB46_05515 [Solirubrobacterales bacterium]|nr:hypothetical protein [Solirubrobacterales bacterium]